MKYLIKPFAILCLLTVGLRLSAQTSLKVGMVEWAAFSPLNVAAERGYWAGLDVNVIVFGSNAELNTALENGRIDVALDMLGSWVGLYEAGVPLVLLGETDWSNGGDKIILAKGLDAEGLAGKNAGIYLNQPSVTFFLNQYLESKRLKFSDLKVVEMEPEALSDNFLAGRFSLIVNYDPQAMRAEKGGGVVAATSATFPGVIPEGFVALKTTVDRVSPRDWDLFFRGWYKAAKWAADEKNWPEFQTILCERTFRGTRYSDAELKSMLASVRIFSAAEASTRNAPGGSVSGYLERLQAFLKSSGALPKPFSGGDLLRTEMLIGAANAEK